MPAKILLVDDDLQSLKLVGLMLQRRGHTIIAARGGELGLEKAQTEQPDLMILDVMMPDLDGLEVCRRLRSNPATEHIPIIMFTAKILVRDKVEGFQAGADDYLTKPIHPNELAARVEAVLQRHAPRRANQPEGAIGRVIGFLGVKGGVGTTTLALNVAAALIDPTARPRVIVADLQSSAANVAVQLKLAAGDGLNVFVQHPAHEITPALVEPNLAQHSSGLQLLLANAERDPDAAAMTSEQVMALIGSLSQLASYVVLDLGSTLDELTLAAVNTCQQIVLVLEPQRIAVAAARNLLAQLERQGIPTQRLMAVVVNRAAGAVTLDKRAIETQLNLPVSAVLPPVPEVASQAAQDGALILHLLPGSAVVDQVRGLTQRLTS